MPDLACRRAPLHQDLPCLSRKSRVCPTLATGVSSTAGCVPSAGSRSRRWAPGPDSFGTAPALASCGDSLRLPCFSSRPASVGVWSPFVCPRSERRKVLLKARLLCSHRHTHVTPNQGLCLVYLADVLPEQMGRGNDSLSHFCLHGTPAHPSFSRLASPGRAGGPVCPERVPTSRLSQETLAAAHPTCAFPSSFRTKVYIMGYPYDETGSRLDKVKLHFYKVPVWSWETFSFYL